MKFDDLVSLVLEANLYNKDDFIDSLKRVLERKGVQKPEIINWFLKHYVAHYTSSTGNTLSDIERTRYSFGELRDYTWEPGHPEWAKKPGLYWFAGFEYFTRGDIEHMVDYFNQLDENDLKKIYKEPYPAIKQKIAEWDKYLGSRRYKGPPLKEGIDVETVMKFDNGYRWEKLITQQAYTAEGEMMGHCVGGYCEDENSIIYSLKDPKGDSHATIEYQVRAKGITQIKGRGNEAPVEKYRPYVKEFITKFNFNVLEDGGNAGMVTIQAIDETGYKTQVYAFKDTPKYQEILNNTKQNIQKYVNNIFEEAEYNEGLVERSVELERLDLEKVPDFSKIRVKGFFDISHNKLTSLKGCPLSVRGDFHCVDNKLKNLEGGPKIVETGHYDASYNEITSLKGFPNLPDNKYYTHRLKVYLDDNKIEDIDLNDIPQLKQDYDYLTSVHILVRNNPISMDRVDELNRIIREKYGKTEIRIFGGPLI